VLNAGIGSPSSNGTERSADGFELIWATNHLGHFAFANLVRSHLAPNCTIVVVSSDLHNATLPFTGSVPVAYPAGDAVSTPDAAVVFPVMRYAQSKLCNVYFAYELARRLAETKLDINAFNSERMLDTEFVGYTPNVVINEPNVSCVGMGRELVDLAIGERWKDTRGKYVNQRVEQKSSQLSYNVENARERWETSKKLAGLESTF
jgi:NAD(P)-dependent dehydrogenase (short-subunit alcohol dehydrogenase family)